MIPQSAIRTAVSPLELLLKISLQIGSALFAA